MKLTDKKIQKLTADKLIDKFNSIADKYHGKGAGLEVLSDWELFIYIAGKTLDHGRPFGKSIENAFFWVYEEGRERALKQFNRPVSADLLGMC